MTTDIKEIRCPYCGARDRLIKANDYFKCSYCSCEFYLASDENKILLNQAQLYLKGYNFTSADDIYNVLALKGLREKNYDLYCMGEWGQLLSYFGVVYVKSFTDNVTVPTIVKYDSNIKSIKESRYYKNIMDSKAKAEIKKKYEEMANKLDETYSKIYPSLKEAPQYDVFICVKISMATEANPNLKGLTYDQEDARVFYDELTKKGYRVFYSPISTQGIEYDSLIYTALAKSKLLLVISRDAEYLESAWVQSEWRRWLSFIRLEDKPKNSMLLYLPEHIELPTVLQEAKIQYFDNAIKAIKHIEDTLKAKGKKHEPEITVDDNLLRNRDLEEKPITVEPIKRGKH